MVARIMRYEDPLSLVPFASSVIYIRWYIYLLPIFSLGPYAVNGVPLRRVNQKYVIATSTKVDLAGVNVSDVSDGTFARNSKDISKGPSATRAGLQKAVDAAVAAALKKTPMLENYIKSKFSLSNSDKPHAMKF